MIESLKVSEESNNKQSQMVKDCRSENVTLPLKLQPKRSNYFKSIKLFIVCRAQ